MDDDFGLIRLFAYEQDGGYTSILWSAPNFFSHLTGQGAKDTDERYFAWKKTKRAFTVDEMLTGWWIKRTTTNHIFIIKFHINHTLTETGLVFPKSWKGTWRQDEGAIRTKIGRFETYIIANKTGTVHAGIETVDNNTPLSEHVTYISFRHIG